MKFLIVFLAVLAVVYADDWQPIPEKEFFQIRADCMKENHVTEDQINQMKSDIIPDEENIRNFVLCASIRMNFFSTETGYYADRLFKQFELLMPTSEMLPILQFCVDSNKQGSSTAVWAFRNFICIMSSKMGPPIQAYVRDRLTYFAKKAAEDNKL